MSKTYLLVFILLVFGCEKNVSYQPSEKEHLTNIVSKEVAIQLKNELGLTPCGSGGQAMDQVKMLALAFNYHEPLDIETGREFLVAAVEKFAAEINSNEAIRPYLNNYPFGPKNIEIAIYIQDLNGRDMGPEELCVIVARRGILEYEIPDGKFALKTVHKETYEEALEKLNRKKQSA